MSLIAMLQYRLDFADALDHNHKGSVAKVHYLRRENALQTPARGSAVDLAKGLVAIWYVLAAATIGHWRIRPVINLLDCVSRVS